MEERINGDFKLVWLGSTMKQTVLDTLSKKTLERSVQWLDKYPYKRGIISDLLRQRMGKVPHSLKSFVRYEAHLNLGRSNQDIDDQLIEIGFEPDDFIELFPIEYNRNFTFSFDVAADTDSRKYRSEIETGCRLAFEKVLVGFDDWAFVEAERFPSANIKKYVKSNTSKTSLSHHGLAPLAVVNVPNKRNEENEFGHTSATHKVIDVHVKIRGIVHPKPDFQIGELIENEEALAAALQCLGMYRITSISGNTIYTAQFANGSKGQKFFSSLDSFLKDVGFAESMIVEPCFLFLRNERDGELAPLCPLLE